MTAQLDLDDASRSRVWLVGETELDSLDAAAHAHGLLVRRATLLGCRDKRDLLARIARMLGFPATFGGNWDALADCLGDLAWLPSAAGYAWLFDHAGDLQDASQDDFDTFCDILDATCARWRQRGVRCFAILALPDDAFPESGD